MRCPKCKGTMAYERGYWNAGANLHCINCGKQIQLEDDGTPYVPAEVRERKVNERKDVPFYAYANR